MKSDPSKAGLILLLMSGLLLGMAMQPSSSLAQDASRVFEEVSPATVSVFTPLGIGSGFVINPEGFIVTCAHVVGRGKRLKVKFANGQEFAAQIIKMSNRMDLALIKIETSHLPAVIVSVEPLKPGHQVYAVGAPMGMDFSLSEGIIANPKRVIMGKVLIQTNMAINSGNSGGPLLDSAGRVVGINSMKMNQAEGIGFAIPAASLVGFLESTGVEYSAQGELSPEERVNMGAGEEPDEEEKGVTVAWVVAGVLFLVGLAGAVLLIRRRNARCRDPEIVLFARSQTALYEDLGDVEIDLQSNTQGKGEDENGQDQCNHH